MGNISHSLRGTAACRGDSVRTVATATRRRSRGQAEQSAKAAPSYSPTLVKDARGTRSTIFLKLLMAASGLALRGLRAGAHVRQPQGLRRARRLQRVRGAPADPGRAAAPLLRLPLGHARGARRRPPRPRLLRGGPLVAGQAGAHAQVRREEEQALDVRLPPDALGRRDAAAVHRLAPAQLLDRQGQRHRGLHQRPLRPARRLVLDVVAHRHLPRGDGDAGRPPPPRDLELDADAGPHQQPAVAHRLQAGRVRAGRDHRRSGFSLVPIFVLAGVIS